MGEIHYFLQSCYHESAMSNSLPTPWQDALKMVHVCPMCRASFQPLEARVLGQDGETSLVHIHCRSCAHAVIALVITSAQGVSSVGVVTDTDANDVVRLSRARVNSDDVLAAHTWLSSGGFIRDLAA